MLSLSGSLLPSLPPSLPALSLACTHTRHVTCCLPGTAIPIAASTRIRDTSHATRATQTWQHCFRAPLSLSVHVVWPAGCCLPHGSCIFHRRHLPVPIALAFFSSFLRLSSPIEFTFSEYNFQTDSICNTFPTRCGVASFL